MIKFNTFVKWFVMALATGAARSTVFKTLPNTTSVSEWWGILSIWFVAVAIWFYGSYEYTYSLKDRGYKEGYYVMWVLMIIGAFSVVNALGLVWDAIKYMNGW